MEGLHEAIEEELGLALLVARDVLVAPINERLQPLLAAEQLGPGVLVRSLFRHRPPSIPARPGRG